MARPNKEGLDYFYLSVDYGNGDAIELIESEFGAKGFRIVTKLLQRVFKKKGYYLRWTEKEKLLFASAVGEPGSLVDEVISRLFKWGFFSDDVFKSFEILTSKDIQSTYLDAAKRRGSIEIIEQILMCSITEHKNVVIVDINSINVNKSTQSRVKKSKGNDDVVINTPPPIFPSVSKSIDVLAKECLADQVYFVEHICRQNKVSPDKIQKAVEDFNNHLRSTGELAKTTKDYRGHFQNWFRKQPQATNQIKIKMK